MDNNKILETPEMNENSDDVTNEHLTEDHPEEEEDTNDSGAPIDRGWAWMVDLGALLLPGSTSPACFLLFLVYTIQTHTHSVLLLDFTDHFQCSVSVITALMSTCTVAYCLATQVSANVLVLHFTHRSIAVCAALVCVVASLLFVASINIPTLFISNIIKSLCKGCTFIPTLTLVGFYFRRRRALATALGLLGQSVSFIVAPPLIRYLKEEYGLRGCFLLLTGIEMQAIAAAMLLRPLSSYTAKKPQQDPKSADVEAQVPLLPKELQGSSNAQDPQSNAIVSQPDHSLDIASVIEDLPVDRSFLNEISISEVTHDEANKQEILETLDSVDFISNTEGTNLSETERASLEMYPLKNLSFQKHERPCNIQSVNEKEIDLTDKEKYGLAIVSTTGVTEGVNMSCKETVEEEEMKDGKHERARSMREDVITGQDLSNAPSESDNKRIVIQKSENHENIHHGIAVLQETDPTKHIQQDNKECSFTQKTHEQPIHAEQIFRKQNGTAELKTEQMDRKQTEKEQGNESARIHSEGQNSSPNLLQPVLFSVSSDGEGRSNWSLVSASLLGSALSVSAMVEQGPKTAPEGPNRNGKCSYCAWVTRIIDVSLLKNYLCLMIFASYILTNSGAGISPTFLPSYAIKVGVAPAQAAVLLTIVGATDIVARLGVGYLADLKLVRPHVIIVISSIVLGTVHQFVSLFQDFGELVFFAVMLGLLASVGQNLHTALIADVIGMDFLAKLWATSSLFLSAYFMIQHPVQGALIEGTGDFLATYLYVGVSYFLIAALLLCEPLIRRLQVARENKAILQNTGQTQL